MKMRLNRVSQAVMQTLVLGAGIGMVGAAYAQDAAKKDDKVERIEVTGTRITSANLESTSPITTLDAAAIKADGLRSVENLLNNLPQVFANQGANVSNGATGTATVDLRGLGPTRTLVLVNGRRLPAGSPRTFAADLNQIPAPLIKKVEILTGGAGAVYGSDAVSGVVNFIMNDKFEGVQLEANHSFYNHDQQGSQGVRDMVAARAISNSAQFMVPGDKSSDGKINDFSITMGSNFANGKGNATLFFNYKKEDALLQSERDFSACSVGNASTSGPTGTSIINGITFGPGFRCGGSGTSYPGQFITASGVRTVANTSGGTRAYVSGSDQYNFGPLNYFQRPSERYGFNAFANYDIANSVKLYSEFSFHDDRTIAQIAPSGLFGLPVTVDCANPLLSSDWRRDLGCAGTAGTADVIILRRNVEGGGRQDDIRHTSYRFVLGLKGDLGKTWQYDAYLYEGRVAFQETYKNDFSASRSALAMDVIRDANGNIVCRDAVARDAGCVPYNVWSLGGVTPAALNYLQTPGFQRGSTEQKVQGLNFSADLTDYGMKFPAAKNGIGVAFGLERRTEKLNLDTDQAFSTGDLFGQGGPTIGLGGKYTVNDFYGEFRMPLAEGAPMADVLSINGSYRSSDYSNGPKTDSYGIGLEWAPIKELRARGSYQEAVRAPNVIDLFTAQGNSLFDLSSDPCGPLPPGPPPARVYTLAECQRTGVTAAQYRNALLNSPAGQYNQLTGGNPNLKPEESKSYTIGFVVQPMRNLAFTVDYFHIKVEKVIGNIPAGTTLSECLNTGNAAVCSLIRRDSQGTLWLLPSARISALNENLGLLQTSGFDFSLDYVYKLPSWGSLKFNFNGTKVDELLVETVPGRGAYDCKGLHGSTCGVPTPSWRHKARMTWQTPWNVDMAATWRHIASVEHQATSSNPQLSATIADIDRTLGKRDYIDLFASWNATKALTVQGGINNVFDKDPPLSGLVGAGFGNGNTYPQVYDALGRRVFINATYKF